MQAPTLNGRNNYAKLLREIFAEYDFAPKTVFESDFGATILSLVGKGLGVSLMPISYAHHSPPKVRFIETTHHTDLFIIRRQSDGGAVLENFVKVIERNLANQKRSNLESVSQKQVTDFSSTHQISS